MFSLSCDIIKRNIECNDPTMVLPDLVYDLWVEETWTQAALWIFGRNLVLADSGVFSCKTHCKHKISALFTNVTIVGEKFTNFYT